MNYTLITGATSGIGYSLAKACAKRNQNLILVSRSADKMQEIARNLQHEFKITVLYFTLDLTNPKASTELYDWCQKNGYTVTTLINNAGIGLHARAQVDQPLYETEQLLQLNLHTVTTLSMLFGKDMKEHRYGFILNVASTAAFQPMPYAAVYGASKAYVLSLSEAMAMELRHSNIGITAVCPGITDTNFFKEGKPHIPGWLYRLISPDLVAERALKALYAKKISVVPYFQHWVIAQLSRFMTRNAAANLMLNIEKMRKRVKTHA